MRFRFGALFAIGLACSKDSTPDPPPPIVAPVPVLDHHNGTTRGGAYVEPRLTRDDARRMRRETTFDGRYDGTVHAQPLYVPPSDGKGPGRIYVVTEKNDVFAFAEDTGAIVWQTNLGAPADHWVVGCGNAARFGSIGITSTPAIDLASRTMFVDSVVGDDEAGNRGVKTHLIHALSLDDGSERPGWPIDPKGMVSNGHTFDPTTAHQRGALLLVDGVLYIPYGSLGDCGIYYGWILAIAVNDPAHPSGWSVPGTGCGIWAPSGLSADDTHIFAATGNSGEPEGQWACANAVLRFPRGMPFASEPDDVYAPANWHDLDIDDADLGGSGALLFDLPGATPSALAMAFGKDGFAYLLDRNHLGGVGNGGPEGVDKQLVAAGGIIGAPVAYTTKKGTYVAVDIPNTGVGSKCPSEVGDLIALRIVEGSPPTMQTVWCAANQGHGSPIVTTTDGTSEPILWITADSSEELHAYDADTGERLFFGGTDADAIPGMHRFNTLIAANGRIFVAADTGLYAFGPKSTDAP